MSNFLRVAKPVAVIAGLWGLGWSAVGFGIGVVLGLMIGAPFGLFLQLLMNAMVGFAILGFSAGVVFSIVLALLESGAPAEQLTKSRVALAGAIGGALLPTVMAFPWLGSIPTMIATLVSVAIFGSMGLASSLGMLRLLRAPSQSQAEADKPLGVLPR